MAKKAELKNKNVYNQSVFIAEEKKKSHMKES